MKIVKSNGTKQDFNPNKILNRIKKASKGLKVEVEEIFKLTVTDVAEGMTTKEIDEIIAFRCADKIISHPDYSLLGGRILVSTNAKALGIELQEVDENYNFFSAYTFFNKYSKRDDKGNPTEIPSSMYKRSSSYLSVSEKDRTELLEELLNKRINFSSPIYTNSNVEGRNSLISCNLTSLLEDSLEGIETTKFKIAEASKDGAGIGLSLDKLRSRHSLVSSFKFNAAGIVRMADMVQSTMRYYKQGNRSGSCALYLSLWHRDIQDFLKLRLQIGDEKERARDLFLGVVVNDLFMQKLKAKEDWYLFCPNDILKAGLPSFEDLLGDEFEDVYYKAIDMGLGHKVTAKSIWDAIITSQVESGNPYVVFKENMNKKNMQDNIGIIKQSNLCAEIIEVAEPGYTAQCTLGSINLGAQDSLETIAVSTKVLVKALNVVIDKNKWSNDWAEAAGKDQRALAIGVAGLADFFAKRKISFESEEAKQWNKDIFETIYKAAVEESNKLAVASSESYPAWKGSRYERGETYIEGWSPIKEGPIAMKNSLLVGLMPTASSAILLGVFESFEPVTSNFFSRRVGQGEFLVVNEYLVKELEKLGLWNDNLRDQIISNRGSVQNILDIPQDIRYRYKDVWEIPQKTLLDLSIIRNQFVDQSQSLNVYHANADYNKISSALMYAWEKGLKTGVYYTRTKSLLKGSAAMAVVNNVVVVAEQEADCDNCTV